MWFVKKTSWIGNYVFSESSSHNFDVISFFIKILIQKLAVESYITMTTTEQQTQKSLS